VVVRFSGFYTHRVGQYSLNVKSSLNRPYRTPYPKRSAPLYPGLVDHEDPEVTAALAAVRTAFESVRSRADDPAKFHAVSQFADGVQQLRDEASAERRAVVRRYRDQNQLSLKPLAAELSISKTRAWQLAGPATEEDGHG